MDESRTLIVVLFTIAILLMGANGVTPVFAAFCQISNFTYNYPQQVNPGQNFSTTAVVSGVCAPDDANYYSIRVDLNDISGQVLSVTSVPIGFSQGQNWTVSVPNHVTAPTNVGSWQIQFAVYIFAAVGSGGTLDSVTIKPVTIQVGTAESAQTVSSSVVTTLNQAVTTSIMTSTVASTSSVASLQTAGSDQSSVYRILAAFLVIVLLVMVVVLVKQRKQKQAQK